MKKLLLIILCLTLNYTTNCGKGGDINEVTVFYGKVEIPEFVIKTIKVSEGLSTKPYNLNNHWYIGYGHLTTDSITNITVKQADSLLYRDLNLIIFNSLTFKKLARCQTVALTMLMYNCGISCIENSELFRMILNNEDISNKWLEYCYFKGKKHKGLLERRKFELLIYQNNLKL